MAYSFDSRRERALEKHKLRQEAARRDPLEIEAERVAAQMGDIGEGGDPEHIASAILARMGEAPAKVHTGVGVDASLASKGAEAATRRGEIYLGSSDPAVIAHEAAHVVQQRRGQIGAEQYRLLPVERLPGNPMDAAPVPAEMLAMAPQLPEQDELPTPEQRAEAYQMGRMQYSSKNFLRVGKYMTPGQQGTEPAAWGLGNFNNTRKREGLWTAVKNQFLHRHEETYDPIRRLEGLDPLGMQDQEDELEEVEMQENPGIVDEQIAEELAGEENEQEDLEDNEPGWIIQDKPPERRRKQDG